MIPAAPSRSKWRQLLTRARGLSMVSVATLVACLALLAKFQVCRDRGPSCHEAWDNSNYELAVLVCGEAYEQRGDPETGIVLADSLLRAGNRESAEKVASALLHSKVHAEALLLLGKISRDTGRVPQAQQHLSRAADLFIAAGQWDKAAKALLAWARITMGRQEYIDALEQIDRCVSLANSAGDLGLAGDCHLAASRVLLELGNNFGAREQLQITRRLWREGGRDGIEMLDIDFHEANYLQETGQVEQSVARFKELLANMKSLGSRRPRFGQAGVLLNLAYSLAMTGRFDEAAEHIRSAKSFGAQTDMPADVASIEGFLEWKRGNLPLARTSLQAAIDAYDDNEQNDKVETAIDLVQIDLQDGDLRTAAVNATRTVEWLEQLRAKQQHPQFRSWATERYRKAYELLFVAMARQGLADEALAALDRWQRQDALDRMTPRPPNASSLQQAATEARQLASVKTSLQGGPRAGAHDLTALKQQLAGQDFLALVVANDEVWRLAGYAGQLHIDLLGPLSEGKKASELSRRIDELTSSPLAGGAPDAATVLGARLVPRALAVPTGRVLHVLLDSRLELLPIEAVKIEHQRLGIIRPIVRILRPSDLECAPAIGPSPHALVLADASRDLPWAAREAAQVAAHFGMTAATAEQATRAALWQAFPAVGEALAPSPVDVLHLAVHAAPELERSEVSDVRSADSLGGGVLYLHDGPARALDIATRGGAPSLVVLASCRSGVTENGTYSLAKAFLMAGSDQVIATLRKVNDEKAVQVSSELYRSSGERDPVRAMVRVRAKLAATNNDAWPRFVVFGRQTCAVGRPPRQ